MSDRSTKSAPASDAITDALHSLLKAVAAYERAGRLAYHCRSCGYAADKKWEGPCPGCRGFYNSLDKADRESMKDAIVAATVRYADAVKGVEGYSWKAMHDSSGVPLLPDQQERT